MKCYDVKKVGIDALLPDPEEEHYKYQGINKMASLIRELKGALPTLMKQ